MVEVTFREATMSDAAYVADHLRATDIEEIKALGLPVKGSCIGSWAASDYVWVGCVGGKPIMIFGCSDHPLAGSGEVWALGTDACSSIPREMLVWGRKKLREMLDLVPYMENHCLAKTKRTLRWLRKVGFTVEEPKPYGIHGEEFCKLSIRKEH